MEERIKQELELLRRYYPDLEYREEGRWLLIRSYPLPDGWNRTSTNIAFQIKAGYPGTPPYGFCVPVGLTYGSSPPTSYKEPASPQPPFGGTWGVFSWAHDPAQWRATADLVTGSNLLNWVKSFGDRFTDGA